MGKSSLCVDSCEHRISGSVLPSFLSLHYPFDSDCWVGWIVDFELRLMDRFGFRGDFVVMRVIRN